MSEFIQSGTMNELMEVNEANYLSYARTYSAVENTEFLEDEKLMMAVTPVDGVSMVNNCVSKSSVEEEDIGGILKKYKEAGRPVMWIVFPNAASINVCETLKNKKMMHVDTYTMMHCDMNKFETALPLTEGLTIKKVDDIESFADWGHLMAISFGLTDGVKNNFIKKYAGLFLDNDISGKHYLCYLNDKPVGTSTVYISDGVAGIYNITTAPEARGKGVGDTVTRMAMIAGKEKGCAFATLQATKMGKPVYEKIGYESGELVEVFVKMYGKSIIKLPATMVQRAIGNQLRKLF